MKDMIIPLLVCAVLILGVLACAWGFDYATCIQKTSGIELPSRFLLFGGCQVQENGAWIPLDNWRYFGE